MYHARDASLLKFKKYVDFKNKKLSFLAKFKYQGLKIGTPVVKKKYVFQAKFDKKKFVFKKKKYVFRKFRPLK